MDRVSSSCRSKNTPSATNGNARSTSFHIRFPFMSSIIILTLALIQKSELAAAQMALPVIRSFSQLEGSGAEEGGYGMTAEHAQQLRDHDYQRSMRHRRELYTSVADFPLAGNEYYVGLYYTEIGLGTPPHKYFVQVDSGSDLLWVNCVPCPNCPTRSDLNIPIHLYSPSASSTSKNSSCTSNNCRTLTTVSESSCVDQSCYYSFGYGDGSTAMGYLVEDVLTYDSIGGTTNVSTTVAFGCGFNQTGDSLTSPFRAVDGIMGFGQQLLSVLSQLVDSGLTTNEFAHCLQGDTGQGGIFVIGDVNEPGIVYTPLIPRQFHYNVNLLSISVGGVNLDISPSVFDLNGGQGGTIFDSGTTMALLVDTAYNAFYDKLMELVTAPTVPTSDRSTCFESSNGNLENEFPAVTLQFDGASMQLGPRNYLFRQRAGVVSSIWCLAWSSSQASGLELSILGDIVLKNKLVVYDLQNSQIGWVDFDCLSSVHVSNGTGSQVVNPNPLDISQSSSNSVQLYHPISVLMCSVVVLLSFKFL